MAAPARLADALGMLETKKSTALAVALPEVALLRDADPAGRRKVYVIIAASVVFAIAVAIGVFALLAKQEKTARHASTKFASALVHNDESLAPDGGSGYVRGLRSQFGAVTSARVIDAHNHTVPNSGQNDSRTYFQTELLIGTRRGPAVIEVSFDNHAFSSERISGVKELDPSKAKGLSKAERAALDTAFAKRGGQPANDLALSGTMHTPAAVNGGPNAVMRCVQNAGGDATKLQACVQA
jgi:hypothetical protein